MHKWALQLLITQLYDTSEEVCDVAIMYLEEICADSRRLQMVVDHCPSITHLDDSGHSLFMRYVEHRCDERILMIEIHIHVYRLHVSPRSWLHRSGAGDLDDCK
jgi:hypothetical protein